MFQVLVESVARSSSTSEIQISSQISSSLSSNALALLLDEEVRVRLAAGELLGSLAKAFGINIYDESKGILHRIIQCWI